MEDGGNGPFIIGKTKYKCNIKFNEEGYYEIILLGNNSPVYNSTILYESKGENYILNLEDDFSVEPLFNNLESDLDTILEDDFLEKGLYLYFRSSDSEKYSPVFGRNIKGGKN
jgi:hypothetical protein